MIQDDRVAVKEAGVHLQWAVSGGNIRVDAITTKREP
jgi:hypothetical protein